MAPRGRRQCTILLIASFALVLVALFGPGASPAFAASDDAASVSTVKVGVFTGEGYAEQDADGNWNGIDIEMTENIAQAAGIRVEFVETDSVKQALDDLDSGTIDMLADIAKTTEREQKYLFSEYEQGSTATNIFIRDDDARWNFGDVAQMTTMRFSCERNNIVESDFLDWCSKHNFTPTIVEYNTGAEAADAVTRGEVDGYVDGEDSLEGFRTILSFAPSSYYYAFAKTNTDLKSKIDTAMGQIYSQNPLYEKELLEKYIGLTQDRTIALTKTEQDYIASKGTVVVAVLGNDAPYFSGTESAPDGIIPAFFQKVASETGLTFTYKVYNTQRDAIAAVKSGEVDLVGIFSAGITQAYDNGLIVSRKYATVNTVMITNAGTSTDEIHRIAVKDRSKSTIIQDIPDGIEDAQLVYCETAEDCFNTLKSGKADATMVGLPSATYLINQTNSSAYTIVPLSSVTLDLCAATVEGNNTLVSILNKGINAESYAINGIIADNTVANDSLQTTIAKIPAAAIIAFSCVMILAVLALLWGVFSLSRSRKTKVAAIRSEAEAREQRIKAEAFEKSAQEKSAFFSNISHDMRTPLNAVSGFIRMAAKDDISAQKRKEYLDKAGQSSELLLDLIDDTLTMSKVSSGKLQLNVESVDSWNLFESVIIPIREAAAKKDIDFTADYSQTPQRMIAADRLNVQKILLNLLSNAVKYTPAGGHVNLLITCVPAENEVLDYLVTIDDDGIGISPEFLPHVFEPFAQEKRPGYDAVGTGLGLAIVRQLVDLMGGSIEVHSEKDKGTAFTLHLRFNTSAAEISLHHEAEDGIELSNKKMLVCEDNSLNQEIAVSLLGDRGIRTAVAGNGQVAVQMFAESAEGEYDAILMDVRMPVMDGLQATRTIRAMDRPDAATVPIIAMTADAFSEDIRNCLEAGMNGHVAKPINPDLLVDALNRAFAE